MNKNKSEIGQEENINPKEAHNFKDMKKVMRSMLSFEHYVNLNVKIIHQEEKIMKYEQQIVIQDEKNIQLEEKNIQLE